MNPRVACRAFLTPTVPVDAQFPTLLKAYIEVDVARADQRHGGTSELFKTGLVQRYW